MTIIAFRRLLGNRTNAAAAHVHVPTIALSILETSNPGSDEAIVLEAMREPSFSLWRVERRHETAGLILRDLLRGGETWLVDETMEKTARPGLEIAARVLKPAGFAMTARIVVPVVPNLMEEAFTRAPALRHAQGDVLAGDPRFAIAIYRAAVVLGVMDAVRLKN